MFGFLIITSLSFLPIFLIMVISKRNRKSHSYNYLKQNYIDLDELMYKSIIGMNKGELKNKINKNFIDVQTSWMNFDYNNLSKLCTNELYNQYKTQLEILKQKNEQNIMSDFQVNEVKIYSFKEVNDIIELNIYISIKFKDYVIGSRNNNVIRGDKNIYFNNCYELTFIMSKNDKTIKCPSCGAKVEVILGNKCSYCKNIIVQTSNEIVLSKKKIISSIKI